MLDTYGGFEAFADEHGAEVAASLHTEQERAMSHAMGMALPERRILRGRFFCARCGAERSSQLQARHLPNHWPEHQGQRTLAPVRRDAAPPGIVVPPPAADPRQGGRQTPLTPSVIDVWCAECRAFYLLVAYDAPSGPSVLLLPAQHGSAGTPNTPWSVGYYLDQAARAKSGGAISAAVAMYRSALETLLYEQGFEQGRLSDKLKELRRQKGAGEGPTWTGVVDDVVLELLKEVADGALHPNDGDIGRQEALDRDLLAHVELIVAGLLREVYEVRADHAAAREALQAAVRQLRGRPPASRT